MHVRRKCALTQIAKIIQQTNMEKSPTKFCFIMRGIPGSGKTVVAKKLIENGGIIHAPGVHFLDQKVCLELSPAL